MQLRTEKKKRQAFEKQIMPHLGAAYNLAMYLMGRNSDAEDVVQESFLHAYKAFDTFEAVNSTGWIMTIVRNRCYNALKQRRRNNRVIPFEEGLQSEIQAGNLHVFPLPDIATEHYQEVMQLRRMMARLPAEYREIIILRDIEGMTYKEIAAIADIPEGTVMSRLSRGRRSLKDLMVSNKSKGREQDDAV